MSYSTTSKSQSSFSLKEVCNQLVQELNKDFGNKNIVRFAMDDSIPDLYVGPSSVITDPIKAVSTFMALNLVNGIIALELKEWSKQKNEVSLYVNLSGSGTGEPGVSPKHKSEDQLIRELQHLDLASEIFFPAGGKLVARLKIMLTMKEKYDPTSVFHNKRALIVEDNEVNALVFSTFLEDKGMEVELAYNGEDGIDMAWAGEYDIILMDIYMPGLSGVDATRRIREFNEKVPIVALSASNLAQDVENAFKAGVNDYLDKPIARDKLLSALSRLLSTVPVHS